MPFKKGVTTNPGGRPKELEVFRRAAQQMSMHALKRIFEIMNDPSTSKSTAVVAAVKLIEFAWPKIAQAYEFSGPGGEAIPIKTEIDKEAMIEQLQKLAASNTRRFEGGPMMKGREDR